MKHVTPDEITMNAVVSKCDLYRYTLTRRWGIGRLLPFIMLNPSKADATVNDPTIIRCMGFARRLGYAGIIVMNLYAYRATKQEELANAADPFGPQNNFALTSLAMFCGYQDIPIVCAWGSSKFARAAAPRVISLLQEHGALLMCLKSGVNGMPWHPLYVPADQEFEVFP